MTSTIGLVPGAVGGAFGYADALSEQRPRLRRMAVPTLLGAVAGTALLLVTSNDAFELIVPFLVAGSCLLLLFAPRLSGRMAHAGNERSPALAMGLFGAGAYAAYFGSAVGILLLALLALFVADSLQRLNAVKILLAGLANLLAAIVYSFLAPVAWSFAAVLAVSSLVGGHFGAVIAQRISGDALRIAIACAGLVVAAVLAVDAFG